MFEAGQGEFAALPVLLGEGLPLPDESIDNVVMTSLLCTCPGATAAFGQLRRASPPGGKPHFCEHGASRMPVFVTGKTASIRSGAAWPAAFT